MTFEKTACASLASRIKNSIRIRVRARERWRGDLGGTLNGYDEAQSDGLKQIEQRWLLVSPIGCLAI